MIYVAIKQREPLNGVSQEITNGIMKHRMVSDINPLVKNPWFLGAQGIPLGVLVFGLFLGRRNHKLIKDPAALQHKASKQHIARGMSEMNRAISSHDVPAFFKAGRDRAQQCLSERRGLQPRSITLKDLKERLSRESTGLCRLFECADAATYSGQSFTPVELTRIRDTIQMELMALHEKEAQK